MLGVLHALEALLSRLGPAVFAALVLLAFSVARAAGGTISEDELLAKARLVGDDDQMLDAGMALTRDRL